MRLVKTLEKIASALQAQSMPDRLWDSGDLEIYFGFSATKIKEIRAHPNFPRPFSVLNSQPRYVPDEVREFAKRHRG